MGYVFGLSEKLSIETEDVMKALQNVSATVKPQIQEKFVSWDSKYRAF
jgi:hypothetical protein